MGGTGDAHRGGATGGNGGMGLSTVSPDYALLPLSRRKRSSGTERTRGGEVATQGRTGERELASSGQGLSKETEKIIRYG